MQINQDNIAEWLRSTGFLFPQTEIELERFETLYGKAPEQGTTAFDPEKILARLREHED